MRTCAFCNEQQAEANLFCVYCGAKLPIETYVIRSQKAQPCPRCNRTLVPGQKDCNLCASPIVSDKRPKTSSLSNSARFNRPNRRRSARAFRQISLANTRPMEWIRTFQDAKKWTKGSALFLTIVFASVLVGLPSRETDLVDSHFIFEADITNCESILSKHPRGIGMESAINAGGFVAEDWDVDNELYDRVIHLDVDNDGIACESEYVSYSLLPCDYQQKNFDLAAFEVGRVSSALRSVSQRFPEFGKVSAADAWSIRNVFEGAYQRLQKIQRPYSAFALEQLIDRSRQYFKSWESLSKAYSGGNQTLIENAQDAVKGSHDAFLMTIRTIDGLESGLLPKCTAY